MSTLVRLVTVAAVSILCASCTAQRTVSQPAHSPASRPATSRPAATTTAAENWAADIAAFEADDRAHPKAPGSTVFYGSSSIRIWSSLASDFPDRVVINRGFGGSRIEDCARYLDRAVLRVKPATIVMYAGDNDLAAGRSPQQIADDFASILRQTQAALPEARLAFISIKPSPSRWRLQPKMTEANRLVREIIQQQNQPRQYIYIDVATAMLGPDGQPKPEIFRADKLHMTPAGYAIWTPIIRAALAELDESTSATRP